jgi:DivIVA domain-containing protein
MAESDIGEVDVQGAPEERFQRDAAERIREHSFPLAVRGYDRQAVDDFVDQVADLVADLESRQTREGVVQRALDQVGEETAGILQRAHQAADEYAEKVIVDTQLLWDERQRLLDDLRQLADDVLATADDAAERVTLPEQLGPPEGQAAALTDQPTTEVELDVLPGGAGLGEPDPTHPEEAPPGPQPLQEQPLHDQPLDEAAAVDEPDLDQPTLEEPSLEEQGYAVDEPEEPADEPDTERRPRAGNDE